MKSTIRECILGREGSTEQTREEQVSESSVSAQGTMLYRQSFEERLLSAA